MAKLPNPEVIARKAPRSGGIYGQLSGTMVPDVGPDTAIADAVTRIGDEGHQYAMKEKARLDQVAFDDAKNQYMEESLELKKEVNEIKGKDAVGRDIDKDYTAKIDALSEKLSSGLKNDTQRNAWSGYFGPAKTKFRASVMQHKINESDNWSQEVSDASISNNQDMAIANAHNDMEISRAVFATKEAVARELVRTGNDQDAEISTYKMNEALSPLYFGVIKERITAGQYDRANELLEDKDIKEMLGKNHSILTGLMKTEKLDVKVQDNRDEIMDNESLSSWEKKFDFARDNYKGDEETQTLDALKRLKNEENVLRSEEDRKQTEHDSDWAAKNIDLLENKQMTIPMIDDSGLSDDNKFLWKKKVYAQDEAFSKNVSAAQKTAYADGSKNTYADLSIKIALNPENYTVDDIAKFVNPNKGGLTATQFRTLKDDLKKAKDEKLGLGTTSVKQESRGATLLKTMYDRGDFGKVKTGKDKFKTDSWKIYSDSLVDYKQKFREDPDGDHRQWLDDRIDEEGVKILTKMLDDDWKIGTFGDDSVTITKEFLKQRGIEPTTENIKAHLKDNSGKGVSKEKPDGYGLRNDGTPKGPGYLGEIKNKDGSISTEVSIGVNIDGKETEIPLLVPTLTEEEINLVTTSNRSELPKEIIDKAAAHAKNRIAQGKSPFHEGKPAARTKSTKTVTTKIMKRKDGSHYQLFPNGTKRELTVDKDGKVSY